LEPGFGEGVYVSELRSKEKIADEIHGAKEERLKARAWEGVRKR
jgi:hypothetical protein